jgi:hypothetical protein
MIGNLKIDFAPTYDETRTLYEGRVHFEGWVILRSRDFLVIAYII